MKKQILVLGALLVSLQAHAFDQDKLDKCDNKSPPPQRVKVAKGVDGDTIHVTSGKKTWSVRLLGIDTPETHYMGKSQGYWGEKAAEHMAELLPEGTSVRMEFDAEVCDKNGRVLAHIWKAKEHINLQMVKEGYAVNYCYYPSLLHCNGFGDAANHAAENRLGFFSDPSTEIPYIWRRKIRGGDSTSVIGDRNTKLVYKYENIDQVPVGDRVFFASGKAPAPWKPAN